MSASFASTVPLWLASVSADHDHWSSTIGTLVLAVQLALGPLGWTQTANFNATCLLTMAFAVGLVPMSGLRQKVGAILIGIWAVGLSMFRFAADSAPLGQLLNK
jgi:hypothetical protein